MDNQVLDSSTSNCLSIVCADQSGTDSLLFTGIELMELNEGDKVHSYIEERLASRLVELGAQVTVVAILLQFLGENADPSFSTSLRGSAEERRH